MAAQQQECQQANIAVVDQDIERDIEQERNTEQNGVTQTVIGHIVVNYNTGDVDQAAVPIQNAEQDAENDAEVEQANLQECEQEVEQLLLDLGFLGGARNGQPNNS